MLVRGRMQFDDYFNTANGCISAEHAIPIPDDFIAKIQQIRETFPSMSKENAAIVLQTCDCNLEKAVTMISQDGGADILASWNRQGKKGKNGNAKNIKRRNRRQKNLNRQQNTAEAADNCVVESSDVSGTVKVNAKPDGDTLPDKASASMESPPPSRKSSISVQSESPSLPSTPLLQPQLVQNTRPIVGKPTAANKNKEISKKEVSIMESMTRSKKDLHRSAVALSRFHTVHEERCVEAEKSIKDQFSKLRESLKGREKFLLEELEKVKVEAAKLLDERQEQAANLQIQCNQMGRLPYQEIQELRAEIKCFVGDRKIDEELATSDRFIGDCQSIIEAFSSFGRINPLRASYKQRSASVSTHISAEEGSTPRDCQINSIVDVKAIEQKNLKPSSLESESKSLSSIELKERAEVHSKLVEAVQKQGAEKTSTESHQEHSRVENTDKDTDENREKDAPERRNNLQHNKSSTENESSFRKQNVQSERKKYDQRQKYLPPRHRQERQSYSSKWDRRSQNGRDRYQKEWNFFGHNDDTEISSKSADYKKAERSLDEKPIHRHRRRDENTQGRRQNGGEGKSYKSKPEYKNDGTVNGETNADAKEIIRKYKGEDTKGNIKERSSSSIETHKVDSLNDQNNNNTGEIKDLSEIKNAMEKELTRNGKVERNHPGKEGKMSRGHGGNYHRKDHAHESQRDARQSSKETVVEKTSTLGVDAKLRNVNKGDASSELQVAEATCKSAMDKEEKSPEDPIAASNRNEANGRGKQPTHNPQRRSSDKTDKSHDKLPKREKNYRRYNRRYHSQSKGDDADLHKEGSTEQSGKTRQTGNNPQKIQRSMENRRPGHDSKKIRGNVESESKNTPKQESKEVKRSWADEVIKDSSVNCNGHID